MKKIALILSILIIFCGVFWLWYLPYHQEQSRKESYGPSGGTDKEVIVKVKEILSYLDEYYKTNKVFPTTNDFDSNELLKFGLTRAALQYYSGEPTGYNVITPTNKFYITYRLSKSDVSAPGDFYKSGCADVLECGGVSSNYKITNLTYKQYLSQ